jgi:hypothetical protein
VGRQDPKPLFIPWGPPGKVTAGRAPAPSGVERSKRFSQWSWFPYGDRGEAGSSLGLPCESLVSDAPTPSLEGVHLCLAPMILSCLFAFWWGCERWGFVYSAGWPCGWLVEALPGCHLHPLQHRMPCSACGSGTAPASFN